MALAAAQTRTREPLISVGMPFYNAQDFLKEAVLSIVNQTYENWELLLVDDGSQDNSCRIASRFARNDRRIKIFTLPENRGLAYCRNLICNAAAGAYLAWNDADDLSRVNRLANQLNFALHNPDTALFGSATNLLNEQTGMISRRFLPVDHNSIVCNLPFLNPLSLNTAFIRKDFYSDPNFAYSHDMGPSSDYDMWSRAVLTYRARNSFKITASYRIHPGQMSQTDFATLEQSTFDIQKRFLWNRFGIPLNSCQEEIHRSLFSTRRQQPSDIPDDDILNYLHFLGNIAIDPKSLESTWRMTLQRRWLIYLFHKERTLRTTTQMLHSQSVIESLKLLGTEMKFRLDAYLSNR